MPRRAENFETLTNYRRDPWSPAWFPSVIACSIYQKAFYIHHNNFILEANPTLHIVDLNRTTGLIFRLIEHEIAYPPPPPPYASVP